MLIARLKWKLRKLLNIKNDIDLKELEYIKQYNLYLK